MPADRFSNTRLRQAAATKLPIVSGRSSGHMWAPRTAASEMAAAIDTMTTSLVSRSIPARVALLKAAAHGRDALRVEAEPVHPSRIAGVFDLDAPIHDDGETPRLRNAPALLVDHRKLTPEIRRTDRHRLPGDRGQRFRRAEDVDDVDGNRHVNQAVEAFLPEDLRLARVDRNHAVPVPPEVEPDEIACAQLILRQPDNRDRLCPVEHLLDRQ